MIVPKKMAPGEFFALELYAAAADYLALLGITPDHPNGTPLRIDSPTPELRRREGAAERLGVYLGCVLFETMENGCTEVDFFQEAVMSRLGLVARAAHEVLLPIQIEQAQQLNA